MLGGFADGGFSLLLKNLPRHDLVTISFDLYIHDSWLGNHREVEDEFYPDLWSLSVDKELYVSTTFSNSPCVQQWFCPTQSYPKNYPNNNQAAFSGADKKDLPGLCSPKGISSLYKIKKTISHNQATLLLECLSALKLEDIEASGDCSASWSIDNLSIHTISLN